ncbi:RHS repeat-associated core domain-containing protein [Chryseobacterium piscium]|uniref:RHS repeat-associated core domain-containing protein n=1 Tax=Chryseobacterium piscium TaxID=333702 RepID=A0A3D9BKV1_9FLAO|nr:DUF6443 domain-containing protein [Chryseobacterium piscium]REC54153.1 RHS repeat-associated core domain-containing protein [Chryseobacterium piscium]
MKKTLISVGAFFVSGIAHGQLTNTENYIYSKTYLDYNGTTASKTSETVQYFDGLGRAKQIVNVKASPQQKDVITHIEYDNFGRQIFDFLPVPQANTNNGAISTDPLSNATQQDIYGDERIWSKKILENSPLDRILEQKQVGNAWDSKHVKFQYDANIDGEVKKYIATFNYTNFSSLINLSGNYGTGQLYKNTVIDEDDNKTIEFKNIQGQVIMVRKVLDASQNADTYYVYNDYDQLAYVIPPLASISNTIDDTILSSLCYQYKYDGRNRLVEKKLPGKGWEYMVYDKYDRLVLTQDAMLGSVNNNFNKKGWLFTKYDKFGRIAYTGFFANNASRASMQTALNNMNSANIESRSSSPFTLNGMDVHYTKAAFPTGSMTIMSVNYYDTYPPLPSGLAIPIDILNQPVLNNVQTADVSTKGLLTASYIKNIEDDNWTKNFTWYDHKARTVGTHTINHLGGYTKTESEIDFSGTPKMVVTRHKRLDGDNERVITENFTYDHQTRLLNHTHQVDNNPVEYLTQNKYNELSQLESKKVGGASLGSGLQQVDYLYNIRGWMTQINNPADLSGGDLFGYKIRYNERVGEESPDPLDTGLKVLPRFNGNIAEVDWRTGTNPNENLRRYGYVYDGLNRLKAGFYQNEVNPSATEYYEKLTYDLNGNIINMKRTSSKGANTVASLIDNLTYHYNYSVSGNRLTSVTDASTDYRGYPGGGGTITYDLNGNMKMHPDKGISSINYNYLNLPNEMTTNSTMVFINNYVLKYQYRADGVKLRKKQLKNQMDVGGGWETVEYTTDYLDGFQYSQNIVFGYPQAIQLQFVPTSEGYFDFVKNMYIYNYSDHLGNTRLSYFHNGSGIEVLEESNYYPFGLKHEGYNGLAGNLSYQYKYNGKELQESGMYDYGARFYMPDIGRWGVIDPLAEKMTRHSPYNYAFNNPIRFIDPDGREGLGWGLKDNLWQYQPDLTEDNYEERGFTQFKPDGSVLDNVPIKGQRDSNTGKSYLGFGEAFYLPANSSNGLELSNWFRDVINSAVRHFEFEVGGETNVGNFVNMGLKNGIDIDMGERSTIADVKLSKETGSNDIEFSKGTYDRFEKVSYNVGASRGLGGNFSYKNDDTKSFGVGVMGFGASFDWGGGQPKKLFIGIDTGASFGLGFGYKVTTKAGFAWKEEKN